nr:transposase [Gloeocapsa sp. PCC 73106]
MTILDSGPKKPFISSLSLSSSCSSVVTKTTSGVMEEINNKIKLIIRQSYGFNTFNSWREKLLACLFK